MKKSLNSVTGVVLSSILFILLGLVLLLWPDIASTIVCYSLGVLILVFAVFRIVSFFTDKKIYFIFNLDLEVNSGILLFVRSVLFMYNSCNFFNSIFKSGKSKRFPTAFNL